MEDDLKAAIIKARISMRLEREYTGGGRCLVIGSAKVKHLFARWVHRMVPFRGMLAI